MYEASLFSDNNKSQKERESHKIIKMNIKVIII